MILYVLSMHNVDIVDIYLYFLHFIYFSLYIIITYNIKIFLYIL